MYSPQIPNIHALHEYQGEKLRIIRIKNLSHKYQVSSQDTSIKYKYY